MGLGVWVVRAFEDSVLYRSGSDVRVDGAQLVEVHGFQLDFHLFNRLLPTLPLS
jgi:hypothetical protein